MPLLNLTNNLTTRVVPLDLGKAFSVTPGGTIYTASGFIGAVPVANPALAGNPTGPVTTANAVQLDLGIGRLDAILVLDLEALKVSAGNESYQFSLLGSNDPTFSAGNAELLAFHDFGAAATGRVGSPYTGASPVVPTPGRSVRRHSLLFTNEMGDYLLRYLQLLLTVGGTAPSVTLNSWIADRESMTA